MFLEKTTPYYLSLIDPLDPLDPLARQVRVSKEESLVRPGEQEDPIGDARHARCAGGRLIHRHPDRVLLLVTDRCAAHCRFCFRRERLCHDHMDITHEELREALRYLERHGEIREVILTGGDPLSLSDERLLEILGLIEGTGPRRVRLHTRYPVHDPSRCRSLGRVACRLGAVVVHVNHPREITPQFRAAAAVLREAPFILNQSVLLKGVNTSVKDLTALSYALGDAGILPYYLHYPDLARGISHFRIPLSEAADLITSLQGRVPGYLVPRLMLDIPGGLGKVQVPGSLLGRTPSGGYLLRSPVTGEVVTYQDGA